MLVLLFLIVFKTAQLCMYVTRRCLNGTLRQTGEMRDCHTKINMVETYVRVAPSRAKFSQLSFSVEASFLKFLVAKGHVYIYILSFNNISFNHINSRIFLRLFSPLF